MKRLRVVVVIHGYYPRVGGAERQMQYLAARLRDCGMDMHILTRRYTSGLQSFEMVDGIPVYRLPVPGPKALASLIFAFFALVWIARLKPDLIHAHEFLSPSTVALLANRWLGIPFLVTLHGGGPNGDVQKLMRKSSGQIRLKALRKQSKRFIVVSREIENELITVGIDHNQMILIPNAVDVDLFAPLPQEEKNNLRGHLGISADATVAIFTGRLVPGKRVNHLLEVWDGVRQQYPAAELLIAGSGPEEDSLRRLGVKHVQFLGSIENIAPYLQISDLFILPSIAEGLSVAMLEAMSCGLPVLVTDVGGAREIIRDRENGWLIQPENLSELKEGILSLFGEELVRKKMGSMARTSVADAYSIHKAAGMLYDLYEEVAGGRQ